MSTDAVAGPFYFTDHLITGVLASDSAEKSAHYVSTELHQDPEVSVAIRGIQFVGGTSEYFKWSPICRDRRSSFSLELIFKELIFIAPLYSVYL
jgi:hypothetical protein